MWFLWWLRHGAIGPIEATLFRVNVDWIDFRIYIFELVIRLSKVQQSALRFVSHFEMSCGLSGPLWSSWIAFFTERSLAEQPETFFFRSLQLQLWKWNMTMWRVTGRHTTFRCGLLSFDGLWWGETCCAPNSMDFESCFMPIGARLDHGPGAGNNRTTFRPLGTESCFWFCFH